MRIKVLDEEGIDAAFLYASFYLNYGDHAGACRLLSKRCQGKESDKAFRGFLCDECFFNARRPGSPENRWLLKQVGAPG